MKAVGKVLYKKSILLFVLCCISYAKNLLAHAHHHGPKGLESSKELSRESNAEAFKKISEDYVKNVQPIFSLKCMDCHSKLTSYPWYYQIPGIRSMLDKDINEAREHIDFEKGFPFRGHGTPEEDLAAIENAANQNTMPPKLYRWMHRGSALTESENVVIRNWAIESQKILTNTKRTK